MDHKPFRDEDSKIPEKAICQVATRLTSAEVGK